jgi:hypothetical protein
MISGKILKLNGWPEGKLIGLAKRAAQKLEDTGLQQATILDRLDAVRVNPDAYLTDAVMAELAVECARRAAADPARMDDTLRAQPLEYGVWGPEQIDPAAIAQLENALPLLKSLQSKAQEQLGSSGTGNHFVEWGTFRLYADDPELGLKAGEYLALLSHSGSRGVGFKIANTFTETARRMHPSLDKSVEHLAWLPLASGGRGGWYPPTIGACAPPTSAPRRVPPLLQLRCFAVGCGRLRWVSDKI